MSETPKGHFPYTSGYRASRRDKAVVAVANWLLNTFASPFYHACLTVIISEGRKALHERIQRETGGTQ